MNNFIIYFFILFYLGSAQGQSEIPVDSENNFCEAQIVPELSSRHPSMSIPSMLQLAGGESELVSCLLRLRLDAKPPFLGIRAEKILLLFDSREDVQGALLEDVSSEGRVGLGSVVLSSLPKIKNNAFRKALIETSKNLKKSTTNKFVIDRYNAILDTIPNEYK